MRFFNVYKMKEQLLRIKKVPTKLFVKKWEYDELCVEAGGKLTYIYGLKIYISKSTKVE